MKQNAVTIWEKVCGQLEQLLSQDVYDRWISLIEPRKLSDHTFELSVANDFYQHWLEEHYLSLIQDAVGMVTGEEMQIRLLVDHAVAEVVEDKPESLPSAKPAKPVRSRKKKSAEDLSVQLNSKYTFDSFVVGPSNHFAHAASMAVAQSPAKAYNPLFIYGDSGLGKTHLMQAVGHAAFNAHKRMKVCYMSCEAFLNEYIDALQKKSLLAFRGKYRSVDVLLIDDIQFLAKKERIQEEFFHTFNALFDNHKQIVLTCDRPAREIPGLEHRLVTRFEWGLVTDLETPDVETRIAILRKKQEQLKLNLPDEIIVFIAERIRSNIRRLEGALIRAASFVSLTGREVTLDKLEYLLRDSLDEEKKEVLTAEKIQRVVADYYDIRFADMTSNRRPKGIAFPRQVAMYLCRNLTESSLPEIGDSFNRNHATVLHACRSVTKNMQQDPEVRRSVNMLTQKLHVAG